MDGFNLAADNPTQDHTLGDDYSIPRMSGFQATRTGSEYHKSTKKINTLC
ncbi:hypothetical protein COCHEDRAFT_1022945 [Bipolaris maydis C5]|uniref:Uncharacterized protein n=1 Tax=Cochliobolus heterostrophus (strain C5 / ATCC 48332 / race O) TaxID=701091 RepID=M2UKZ4_COCH5|nr:hypothetical protein COCHEDRAFT_1022945 [Bipolaris maydis C5]